MTDSGLPSPVDVPDGATNRHLVLQHDITLRLLDNSRTLVDTLDFIIEKIRDELRAEHVDILFEYADGLRIEISSDRAEEKRFVPLNKSISGLVLTSSEPLLANDISSNRELWSRYLPRIPHQESKAPKELSVIAAPIEMDGHPIGVINVESGGARGFDADQARLVTVVAAQVSLAITHASLFDEDQLRAETDALLVADAAADNDLVVRQALQNILGTLKSFGFIDADAAEVLFPDPQNPDLLVVVHSTNESAIGLRIGVDESVCGQAFRERRTIVLGRAQDDQAYRPLQDGMKCEMAIPIQLGGSQRFAIGVLNIECARENAFNTVARVLAERFARRVVFILTLTKMRTDVESVVQDQLLLNAADQVLNAVHRINNHLGSVRALVRDLLNDIANPEAIDWADTERRLRFLDEEAMHSLAIPDEVRRRFVGPEESADVNEQVEAGLARARIPRSIAHSVHLHEGLPNIPCTSLDLAVENLVQNAVDALTGTGGTLRVSTSLDQRGDGPTFVVVQVADTGKGMTEEQVAALFDRRRIAHRSGGLGFGMIWVKAWVGRANGLIGIDSELGIGTTVTIRFQIDPHTSETLTAQGKETG